MGSPTPGSPAAHRPSVRTHRSATGDRDLGRTQAVSRSSLISCQDGAGERVRADGGEQRVSVQTPDVAARALRRSAKRSPPPTRRRWAGHRSRRSFSACSAGRCGVPAVATRVLRDVARLEDDHRGFGRTAGWRTRRGWDRPRPALPQPSTLLTDGSARMHRTRPPARPPDDGARVCLEVEPPRGMPLLPAVHRERDEIRGRPRGSRG